MEPALRGLVEKIIDDELSQDKLESNYRIFSNFKSRGLIDSVPSAMFGRIYTRAYNAWLEYKANNGKPVSRPEATEFGRIFETRAMEIRSKILAVSNL
ncbi:MAG TPA: hypothetical protein ENF19_00690 [Candidatus Bathyarchaeota archaeon]|nr:hypothetical protein [Candidatus Bathyarchaeota archaeon]